ncbi:MAG: hypothetical protein KME20_18945 [Kaiparowitsia implicata GSE-PSE-MK54-09C]|nr:hypothetical protein [Kaiparowitsia implicata GSE-PSE-MK54-09C]
MRPGASLQGAALLLAALGISGGLGISGLLVLTQLPPLPECQTVSTASADVEQLHCAREAARGGDLPGLLAAMTLAGSWTDRHPLYAESQTLLATWSQAALDLARKKYSESDMQGAISIAQAVPTNSSLYAEAQTLIATWNNEWQDGEAIYATAQDALKAQNWTLASEQITELGKVSNPYWAERRMAELTDQVVVEQEAWKTLQAARNVATGATPDALRGAIAQILTINPQTHVWQAAQTELQAWSTGLAAVALQRWQAGDIEDAYDLGRQIPLEVALPAESQHLVLVSHAHHLSQWDSQLDWQPSIPQMVKLREAIAALRTIPLNSRFHPTAQALLQSGEAQLADVAQLNYAQALAALGQRATLEWAMAQASLVERDRPRRIQAQTLIDHWQQEIQRIEDMPLMARAYELAQPGTIADLNAAIEAAGQVPQTRALWAEAKGAIDTWTAQIQTLEDRPILTRAERYAADGNLARAVREARTVQPQRALYEEARAAIRQWQIELDRVRMADDRKVLDEATALANRNRLTQAINIANQIGGDRPLHGEAQRAIAQWDAQRAALWQQWEADGAEPSPRSESSAPSSEPIEPSPTPEAANPSPEPSRPVVTPPPPEASTIPLYPNP